MMFLYGAFLIYYVTTKKFKTPEKKPKSQAWHSWDKGDVSYNLPVISKHNDWLGWNKNDHHADF